MHNLKTELLFTVSNHHAPVAGQYPTLDGDVPHTRTIIGYPLREIKRYIRRVMRRK